MNKITVLDDVKIVKIITEMDKIQVPNDLNKIGEIVVDEYGQINNSEEITVPTKVL